MVIRSLSSSNTSHAAVSGGALRKSRLRGFSRATTSSSTSPPAPPLRRLRAASLFLRIALSIIRRQWASLHWNPSLMIREFLSMSCAMASSTGLPKNSPSPFWLLKRNCSSALLGLVCRASAIARMPSESRLLVSMFSTSSVPFFRSDSASWWAWGFIMLQLQRCSETMCVLFSMAFMSLGAIRGSLWGGGMFLPAKLKSVSDGSLSHALWTIQIIQSPRLLFFFGSSTMSAMSVISSTSCAKRWLTPVVASTPSVQVKDREHWVKPVLLRAVTVYVLRSAPTAGEPWTMPVWGSSFRSCGRSGSTEKVRQKPHCSRGSSSTCSPTL
mmetsp:Transcript_44218/g.126209  ORF Transcript_44218/g.126209 Transcript_44218/m.126209 type:complete len:327 (-) Transcript_44218:301-1281(-)